MWRLFTYTTVGLMPNNRLRPVQLFASMSLIGSRGNIPIQFYLQVLLNKLAYVS